MYSAEGLVALGALILRRVFDGLAAVSALVFLAVASRIGALVSEGFVAGTALVLRRVGSFLVAMDAQNHG